MLFSQNPPRALRFPINKSAHRMGGLTPRGFGNRGGEGLLATKVWLSCFCGLESDSGVYVWWEVCGLIGHTLQLVWLRVMSVPCSAPWQWEPNPSSAKQRQRPGWLLASEQEGGVVKKARTRWGLRALTSSKGAVEPTRPKAPVFLISATPTHCWSEYPETNNLQKWTKQSFSGHPLQHNLCTL